MPRWLIAISPHTKITRDSSGTRRKLLKTSLVSLGFGESKRERARERDKKIKYIIGKFKLSLNTKKKDK